MITHFEPPTQIISATDNASDNTKAVISGHTKIMAAQLHVNVECLDNHPGILCFCRCAEHSTDPWVDWLPFMEVILHVPNDLVKKQQDSILEKVVA